MRRALLPLLLALAAAALGAGPALAGTGEVSFAGDQRDVQLLPGPAGTARFHTFPYRWPRGVIRYADTSPARFRPAVTAAVRAWNASGLRLRLVRVPKAKADLVIRTGRFPDLAPSCFGVLGYATTYWSGTTPVRSEIKMTSGCTDMQIFRAVAAHELGHVIGLDHEDARCALMNSVLWSMCPAPTRQWQYRCRLLEKDDLRGVRSLYGGTPRPQGPAFCDSWPAPPKVRDLVVTPDPAGSIASAVVRFARPARNVHADQITVLRRLGSCPTRPDDPAAELVDRTPGGAVLVAAAPGSWCYAVFTADSYGRTRGAVTRTVTHATTAAQRIGLAVEDVVSGATASRRITFTAPASPAFGSVTAAFSADTCAAGGGGSGPSIGVLPAPGSAVSLLDEEPRAAGPACVTLAFATDAPSFLSAYVYLDVALPNHAPVLTTVAASGTPDSCFLVSRVDATASDPEGDFPSLTIAWGDGTPVEDLFTTGFHQYTASGTFTATVTARDAAGLEDVETVPITVAAGAC